MSAEGIIILVFSLWSMVYGSDSRTWPIGMLLQASGSISRKLKQINRSAQPKKP
jgi:hypothetical protein